jgi:8-oxo-dGTP diphosphatase
MEIRSAARLLLLDTHGRLLLFRHNDGHGREFWAAPGGGLEPGETFEQAARREAAEDRNVLSCHAGVDDSQSRGGSLPSDRGNRGTAVVVAG